MRLNVKVLMVVVPLIVAPLVTLGTVAYVQLRDLAISRTINGLDTTLDQVGERVLARLESAIANTGLLARSPVVERFAGTTDERERYALALLPLLEEFAAYQANFPDYKEIRILTPDGFEDARLSNRRLANATEFEGDTPYFRTMTDLDTDVFATVYHDADDGRAAFLAARRLRIVDRTVDPLLAPMPIRGFLAVTLDLSFLEHLVRGTSVGEGGFVFFVDGNGTIIAHPQSALVGTTYSGQLFQRLLEAAPGAGIQTHDDPDAALFTRGVRLRPDLFLIGALPQSQFNAATRSVGISLAIGVLSAICITSVLLLLLLKRMLLRPITTLTEAARRIGGGDLLVTVPIQHRDELGSLGRAFEEMGRNLHEAQAQVENRSRDLEAAVQQTEQASRAKSDFLARMSHEIRTPINGVLGMAELLSSTRLEPKQRRYVEGIRGSGETLLCVINDILDISKIEAGKFEIHNAEFEFAALLDGIRDSFWPAIQARGLRFTIRGGDDIDRPLIGDANRLRQVLTNLIGNALKFTEQGEITLSVDHRRPPGTADDSKIELRFDVRDTGIGIPVERQATIFDAFAQADNSTTRQHGGTGLGLAICRELVRRMGGDIGLISAPDAGSAFWFTVVLDVATVRASSEPASPTGMRLLAVSRAATDQRAISAIAGRLGAQCDRAVDADQAIDLLQRAPERPVHDAVFVDGNLAGGSAVRVAGVKARQPALAHTPFFVLLDAPDEELLELWETAGFDDVLARPLRAQAVRDALARANAKVLAEADGAPAARPRTSWTNLRAKVLLVEDNPVNREVASELLRSLGCTVDTAEDGMVALAAIARTQYDIVLMDCFMPHLDGFQATEDLREREARLGIERPLPVIAQTASAFDADRQRCREAGMTDFISKPFRREELLEVLRRHLPDAGTAPVGDPEPAAAPATKADLDPTALNTLAALAAGRSDDAMVRVVATYLTHTPNLIDEMKQALGDADADGLAHAAHSIKSSSAQIGARRLAELAGDVERLGRAGLLDGVAGLLGDIDIVFPKVRAGLEDYLNTNGQLLRTGAA